MIRERWAISIGEDRFLGVGWFPKLMSSGVIAAGKSAGQFVFPTALFGTRQGALNAVVDYHIRKHFKGAKAVKVVVSIEAAGGTS